MTGAQETRYVFICSASFSGSTLLDMLIGSHPACESLGEVALLPADFATNRVCCCGTNIRQCALWSEVARRLKLSTGKNPEALNLGYLRSRAGNPPWSRLLARCGYGWSYYRHLYRLSILHEHRSEFDEGVRNTFEVYDTVRAIVGKQIVVDSSKHHTRGAALYATRPDAVRVINLVRDGRGVFYSGLKQGLGRQRSVDSWRRHYAHALPLLRKCVDPKHLMDIRYENLVADPQRILGAICRFLSIAYDPAMIDFRATVHHNVNGNDMKYATTSRIQLSEAWKIKLSQSDLRYFERKAGLMNRRFGYQ